jgi:hypothetical protein
MIHGNQFRTLTVDYGVTWDVVIVGNAIDWETVIRLQAQRYDAGRDR